MSESRWWVKLGRDELAKKLLWTAVGAAALAAGLAYKWLQTNYTTLELILAIALVSFLGFAISYYFWVRASYKVPWYPRVGHHYTILEKTIGYEVGTDNVLHFWRRVKVRAQADNLDAYIDKFVWTGGTKKMPEPGEGVDRVEEDITASLWTYYRTVFPRVLRKGEVHEFQVDWKLADWEKSRPFFSTSTEEPTKKLSLVMDVPERCLGPGGVYAEVMRGIESSYPFSVEVLQADRGRVTWSMRPKIYRHYRLRWAWTGAPAVQPLPSSKQERAEESELSYEN